MKTIHGGIYSYFNTQVLTISSTGDIDNYKYRLNANTSQCNVTTNEAIIGLETRPDPSGLVISIENHCLGDAANVSVSAPHLSDGDYEFKYYMKGSNKFEPGSAFLTITSQAGQWIISEDSFAVAGLNGLQIESVQFKDGGTCASDILLAPEFFATNSIPNPAGLTLVTASICHGNNSISLISSSLFPNVYDFTINLSGANTIANHVIPVSIAPGGNGILFIESSLIPISGVTQIEIISINTSFGSECTTSSISINSSINSIPLPDQTTPTLSNPISCLGEEVIIEMSNSSLDVSYQLRNNTDNTFEGSPLLGTGSTIEFTVFSLTSSTYNVLATSTLSNNCGSAQLSNMATVEIIPSPSDALSVLVNELTICVGSEVVVTIENTELNVNYQLQANKENVPGELLSGNGGNLSYNPQSPQESVIYRILATPTLTDSEGSQCETVLLTDDELVLVEGPITVQTQPTNQSTCGNSGTSLNSCSRTILELVDLQSIVGNSTIASQMNLII